MKGPLMGLGFDCAVGILLGHAKKFKTSYKYEQYQIGLFDWCVSSPSNLCILESKLTSYCIDNRCFNVGIHGPEELELFVNELDYPHVITRKHQSTKEVIENYFDRLKYLENKTHTHYMNNERFIVNFVPDLLFESERNYIDDINTFFEHNSKYLKDHKKLITLVQKGTRIKQMYHKFIDIIELDTSTMPTLKQMIKQENREILGKWLIRKLDKLD